MSVRAKRSRLLISSSERFSNIFAFAKDDEMVQQILEVVRLMGGDEQRAFIVHAAADDTFQGLAGGDV